MQLPLVQLPVLTHETAPVDPHPDTWVGKETNVLVLNYTLACPLACDFCCYSCHPKRTEKMDLKFARRLIDEASALGVFSSVGFTGGEALLFEDEIIALSEELKSFGIPFTIATAGHWAKDPRHADELLAKLASNGLVRLNISFDPSHEKFVPRQAIINAATSSAKLGIETHVVGTFYSPDASLDSSLPELKGLVNVHSKFVAKVGRAAAKTINRKTYRLDVEPLDCLTCYRHIYHDVVVFYDGAVYPCCSTFNRASPGLIIGNASQESLEAIWVRLNGSEMFRIMKRRGFGDFYRIIQLHDPGLIAELPSPADVLGPCSLCNAIFKRADIAARVARCFALVEQHTATKVIARLGELIGESAVELLIQNALFKSEETINGKYRPRPFTGKSPSEKTIPF